MSRNNNNSRALPMSIDAMLDMERQEVLALLENKAQTNAPAERMRSVSPYSAAPHSPVRSMLDIAEEDTHSSTQTTSVPQAPVRSMLDIDSSSPPPHRSSRGGLNPGGPLGSNSKLPGFRGSPNLSLDGGFPSSSSSRNLPHPRSKSDAGFNSVDFGPRSPSGPILTNRNDPTSGYQFSGIFSHNSGQQLPKRTSKSSGKRTSGGSLGDILKGSDLSGLQLPGDQGRRSSSTRFGNKSKSPPNRWSDRSRSPATFGPLLSSNKAMLDDGQVVDINSAYRRLSDANLAFSSGSLAQLPIRKRSDDAGEGRLIKDYLGPDGEHLESSDEDEQSSSDDEDRGRKKAPRALNPETTGDRAEHASRSLSDQGDRKTLSLLAAADEERSKIASTQSYQYRSLIPEPVIRITNSSGDAVKQSKNGVHPHTSYDQGPTSATPSVFDSDEEADVDDIKRAQKLSFSMTNILTTPEAHRAIRIIYRGEYNKIAHTAEEENQRLRKYLVATDLSDESTHALEWAIGTVLRDGDTLIAIYCVDEETGIVSGEGSLIPDDPGMIKEQAAAINTVTNTKSVPAPMNPVTEFKRPSAFYFRSGDSAASTPASSPAPHGKNRAEEERIRAVQYMTDRLLRLLRKTRLQVRVIVEVIHCKNPRHLITEVIDLVNPTLVVIGSRGRSALKGVILGSFSNYLVTKSSVPVMVARKRLRKQSKYKQKAVRQINNLSNPAARSLANAIID